MIITEGKRIILHLIFSLFAFFTGALLGHLLLTRKVKPAITDRLNSLLFSLNEK